MKPPTLENQFSLATDLRKSGKPSLSWLWFSGVAISVVLVRALGNPLQLGLPFVSDDIRYFFYAKTTPPFYIFTACIQFYFRPVVHILYWILFHTVSTNFVPVHLALLILHGALASLLAAFMRRLTGAPIYLAALMALFWGIFGGYDEVYYFTSSFATELMGAWFIMLALWFTLRHLDDEGPFWIIPVCMTLAYGSKESSIVILPLICLLCYWRKKLPQYWLIKLLILLIPTLSYLILEYFLQIVFTRSFHKSNINIYFLGWHVLRNLGQTLAVVSGGSIWLNMSWVWQAVFGVPLAGMAIWLGRRKAILVFLMLFIMILPFSLKTVVLIENMTRHIYMPSIFWSLLLLVALNEIYMRRINNILLPTLTGVYITLNAISGISWINIRYEHYQTEIKLIEIILRQINPELGKTPNPLPLWDYSLIDPGLVPLLNVVYFNNRLVDLRGMTPEKAASRVAELGYQPPRALSWEWLDIGKMNGKNVWRMLPDGEVYGNE